MARIVSTSVYLVLEPQRDWQGTVEGIRIDRMIVTEPRKLASRHVAIKVNIEIDAAAFEPFTPEATIEISDGRVLVTPHLAVDVPADPEPPFEPEPG